MTLSQLIIHFVRKHWRDYTKAALLLLIIDVMVVWVPRKVGFIVDRLVTHQMDSQTLTLELIGLLCMGLIIYLLRVGWRMYLYGAAYQFGVELRTRLYKRLSLQGPVDFQGQRTGDLMARATNDVDAVEMAVGDAMLGMFDGSLTLALVLGMSFLGVDWRLTLVALVPFPFMALVFWRISGKLHDASKDALAHFSQLNDCVQEAFAGVRTLRALGLEQRSFQVFRDLTANTAKANHQALKWEATYGPAVGMTLSTAGMFALGLGSYLVWQGQLSIGSLTSFTMYLGQLIWPMMATGWVLSMLERAQAAWGRLEPLLNKPLVMRDKGTLDSIKIGPITMQNVNFVYQPQQHQTLTNINFVLEPGCTLGLVGPTGAGKSTLLRLLLRQFSPTSGELLWGDNPFTDFTLTALRSGISWVPQEAYLFSTTIAKNIALSKPDATQLEIEHVASLAAIHEEILLFPQGYTTPVGERGITLSGGQRQRIALARALLAKGNLLLLDDALSAVDTGTEVNILNHLRETSRIMPAKIPCARSVIIASHRLSAVVEADQIMVLQEGRILECGKHTELIAQKGWYARQFQYQQLEASLDAL